MTEVWSATQINSNLAGGGTTTITVPTGTATGNYRAFATPSVTTSKWYWETTVSGPGVPAGYGMSGVGNVNSDVVTGDYLGNGTDTFGIFDNSSTGWQLHWNQNAIIAPLAAYSSGNGPYVIRHALDLVNSLYWCAIGSGNWNGNSSFAPGGSGGFDLTQSGAATILSAAVVPACVASRPGDQVIGNFASSTWTYSAPAGFASFFPAAGGPHFEFGSLNLRADATAIVEILATQRRDAGLPDELSRSTGTMVSDSFLPFELAATQLRRAVLVDEFLSLQSHDAGSPIEALALARSDQQAPAELLANLRRDDTLPAELLATAIANWGAAVEALGTVARDHGLPFEDLSNVQLLLADARLPIEILRRTRSDIEIPLSLLGRFSVPIPSTLAPVPVTMPSAQWAVWLNQIARTLNLVLGGKANATTSITLNPNATTTTIFDSRIGVGSFLEFAPRTGSAATALASGSFFATLSSGQATINHPAAAALDQTFMVLIIG